MHYRFMRFPNGKDKALTLSYDDGAMHDIRLLETVNKHGIKATLNICSSLLLQDDSGDYLTKEKLLEITKKGANEIANHGRSHVAPVLSSHIDGIRDVLDGRIELEKATNSIIRGYAYPDRGETTPEIKAYLRDLGIAYARTTKSTFKFTIPTDFHEWNPTCRHADSQLFDCLDEFLKADIKDVYCSRRAPMLFYMWGHSSEFKNNNNWEMLEEFAEKAGDRDDIWYATNIEIADYVNAYNSLIFNADNTRVYNPTATDVWFDADGKTVLVNGGQTIEF